MFTLEIQHPSLADLAKTYALHADMTLADLIGTALPKVAKPKKTDIHTETDMQQAQRELHGDDVELVNPRVELKPEPPITNRLMMNALWRMIKTAVQLQHCENDEAEMLASQKLADDRRKDDNLKYAQQRMRECYRHVYIRPR